MKTRGGTEFACVRQDSSGTIPSAEEIASKSLLHQCLLKVRGLHLRICVIRADS
jgi:hypothetical protein